MQGAIKVVGLMVVVLLGLQMLFPLEASGAPVVGKIRSNLIFGPEECDLRPVEGVFICTGLPHKIGRIRVGLDLLIDLRLPLGGRDFFQSVTVGSFLGLESQSFHFRTTIADLVTISGTLVFSPTIRELDPDNRFTSDGCAEFGTTKTCDFTHPLVFRKKVIDVEFALLGLRISTQLLIADWGCYVFVPPDPTRPGCLVIGTDLVPGLAFAVNTQNIFGMTVTWLITFGARQGGECWGECLAPEQSIFPFRVVKPFDFQEHIVTFSGITLPGVINTLTFTLPAAGPLSISIDSQFKAEVGIIDLFVSVSQSYSGAPDDGLTQVTIDVNFLIGEIATSLQLRAGPDLQFKKRYIFDIRPLLLTTEWRPEDFLILAFEFVQDSTKLNVVPIFLIEDNSKYRLNAVGIALSERFIDSLDLRLAAAVGDTDPTRPGTDAAALQFTATLFFF